MVQRRCRKNAFHGRKKLGIPLNRQTSHQYRARIELLTRRLRRKLGKEIHSPNLILPQKANKKRIYL